MASCCSTGAKSAGESYCGALGFVQLETGVGWCGAGEAFCLSRIVLFLSLVSISRTQQGLLITGTRDKIDRSFSAVALHNCDVASPAVPESCDPRALALWRERVVGRPARSGFWKCLWTVV